MFYLLIFTIFVILNSLEGVLANGMLKYIFLSFSFPSRLIPLPSHGYTFPFPFPFNLLPPSLSSTWVRNLVAVIRKALEKLDLFSKIFYKIFLDQQCNAAFIQEKCQKFFKCNGSCLKNETTGETTHVCINCPAFEECKKDPEKCPNPPKNEQEKKPYKSKVQISSISSIFGNV